MFILWIACLSSIKTHFKANTSFLFLWAMVPFPLGSVNTGLSGHMICLSYFLGVLVEFVFGNLWHGRCTYSVLEFSLFFYIHHTNR
jgi:hypothetical protein